MEGTNEDGEPRWFGAITLAQSRTQVLGWGVGGRETAEDAKGAIEELLRGLVAGRLDAMRLHPTDGSLLPRDEVIDLMTAVVQKRYGSAPQGL